jgi:hypothetical protein
MAVPQQQQHTAEQAASQLATEQQQQHPHQGQEAAEQAARQLATEKQQQQEQELESHRHTDEQFQQPQRLRFTLPSPSVARRVIVQGVGTCSTAVNPPKPTRTPRPRKPTTMANAGCVCLASYIG